MVVEALVARKLHSAYSSADDTCEADRVSDHRLDSRSTASAISCAYSQVQARSSIPSVSSRQLMDILNEIGEKLFSISKKPLRNSNP